MVLLAAIAILGARATDYPVGTYRIDISKAPKKDRGLLSPYFEGRYLSVSKGGEFELIGSPNGGQWRKSGSKYVFLFEGVFNIGRSELAEKIKNYLPKNKLEGWILRSGQGGTLVLSEWGSVCGPVLFRPMPQRSVRQLIISSNREEMTTESSEEMSVLHSLRNSHWAEFLEVVNDATLPWRMRAWAAILIDGVKNPEALAACAKLVVNLRPSDDPHRGDTAIKRSLSQAVSRFPTENNLDVLLSAESKGLARPQDFVSMIAALNRKSEIPRLLKWLSSPSIYDQVAVIKTLTVLDSAAGLEKVRTLTASADDELKITSLGYVARMSPLPDERRDAIQTLFKAMYSDTLRDPYQAFSAIIQSKQPEAIPVLATVLLSNHGYSARKSAARALGDIGDPKAVPALLEAKSRKLPNADLS